MRANRCRGSAARQNYVCRRFAGQNTVTPPGNYVVLHIRRRSERRPSTGSTTRRRISHWFQRCGRCSLRISRHEHQWVRPWVCDRSAISAIVIDFSAHAENCRKAGIKTSKMTGGRGWANDCAAVRLRRRSEANVVRSLHDFQSCIFSQLGMVIPIGPEPPSTPCPVG